MDENPTLICQLVVGLGKVEIVGVEVEPGGRLAADTRTRASWPAGLRRGGVVQELGAGAVGRSSGLRAAGTVGVAQVAVVLRGGGLWGRFVH